jgi:hypothetical protein
MPVTAISRVRGIGVALIERTSTDVRIRFICSLCSTPKRCSSSTMIRPRSFILISGLSRRWVPTTMSTEPSVRPAMTSLASLSVWKRESPLMTTGKPVIRSENVDMCWVTSRVVGTRTATCLPSCTALNAARTAISVLP